MNHYQQKIQALRQKVLLSGDFIQAQPEGVLQGDYVVFLSATAGLAKAAVATGRGESLEAAFEQAVHTLNPIVQVQGEPIWVKADVVTQYKTEKFSQFARRVGKLPRNYFREGIAFGDEFDVAFLEQEVHANEMLKGFVTGAPRIQVALQNVNDYLQFSRKSQKRVTESMLTSVHTFKTISYFVDEVTYDLTNTGLRSFSQVSQNTLYEVVMQAGDHLEKFVQANGQITFGYQPITERVISPFNVLYHCRALQTLITLFERSQDERFEAATNRAIQFVFDYYVRSILVEDEEALIIVEGEEDVSETHVATVATFLSVLCHYAKVTETTRFDEAMRQLARGVLLFQQTDGSFIHSLSYPAFHFKNVFEAVRYDGEATIALFDYYAYTDEKIWLQAAQNACLYMKKYNYEKYHDASLQRAFVRLYQTEPKKEYARSITKSALTLFDKTLKNIPTANPMKLYMATFEWIKFVHEQQLPHEEEVAMIDDAQLLEQISIHLQRQLDGWFAPEVAMYFENPHFMNGSFYHRAQQFRVRVDDLYESIDVIIQIIEHLQINDVDVALPATEEIHDSSNKMYFLLKDFNDFYALPQKAALQRGRLFEQQLNESPTYLTYTYDTMLTLKREQLNDRGLLPQQSRILNIYEYYQQTAPFLENPYRNPMKEQAAWTYEEVGHAPKIVDVYNEQQQLIQRHFYSEYRVMRVEHFVHTQCVREDVFDANGYLSKTTQFIEGTTPFVETYYTTMGLPVLYKYFQQNELSAIQLMDHTGTVIRYFDNEQQFVAYGFNEFFKRQKTVNAYIFNEQDAFLRPILEKLPGKKVQVAHEYTTAFAQETNIVTPKIVEGITATTIPYTAWTNEIVAMADRYEGKVAVIGEYLNDEQLLPLINVMAETIKQLPYVKFYIYGGTYSKTQCMQYISQFSLQQNVFIEPVTLLSTMYESAQFTFAPTTVDSISVLEAISFGCPVITFDQASPYIDTAASGYQLQVGEWSMVTQRLVENLQDLQRLHLLSEAAYKKAQLFAPHLVAKKWHSFLQTTH